MRNSTIELQPGETVLDHIQRSSLTMVPGIFMAAMLLLADFFFLTWFLRHGQFGKIAFLIIIIVGLFLLMRTIVLWKKNILYITSLRVIHLDRRGLFEQIVAEATYDKIQDVRYVIKGILATMLSYGTIVIQTAGSSDDLSIPRVFRPMRVQSLIRDQQQAINQRPAAPVQNKAGNVLDVRRP